MRSRCVWYSLALVSILLLLWTKNIDGIQIWGMQAGRAPLLKKFVWKTLDFAYPDQRSRELAIRNGEFVPENSLPVGIEIWRNKLFVTVPRWRDGECQKILVVEKMTASLLSWLNDTSYCVRRRDRQTDKRIPLLVPETGRDASKSGTGSRHRWHNTRKIAVGGARLDSRLSDFRSAEQKAPKTASSLSMEAFLSLSTTTPMSPPNPDPPKNALPLLLSSHLFTCRGKGNTARRNGFIQPRLPFIHSPFFFSTLYVYYIRWRAPPRFCDAQRPNNGGGTLCKLFNVPPFYPSLLLPS